MSSDAYENGWRMLDKRYDGERHGNLIILKSVEELESG